MVFAAAFSLGFFFGFGRAPPRPVLGGQFGRLLAHAWVHHYQSSGHASGLFP
jgi:hypothetical protein